MPQPDASGQDDRRLVVRLRGRARRRALRARARHGHGLLDPAALGRLRGRRAEVAVGADPDRRRLPARARRSTRSARWRGASRTSPSCGRCSPSGPCPSRGSTGSRSGCCGSAPGDRRRARDRAQRRRRGVGRRSRAARRARRRGRDPRRDREHVAAVPARGAAVPRGDVPEPRRRVRRARCRRSSARRSASTPEAGRGGVPRDRASGGATSPTSTSTSARAIAVELPPEDADELEVRLPLSSFLRWVEPDRAGPGSRSGTCSSSRRATRSCSPPASPGSAASGLEPDERAAGDSQAKRSALKAPRDVGTFARPVAERIRAWGVVGTVPRAPRPRSSSSRSSTCSSSPTRPRGRRATGGRRTSARRSTTRHVRQRPCSNGAHLRRAPLHRRERLLAHLRAHARREHGPRRLLPPRRLHRATRCSSG